MPKLKTTSAPPPSSSIKIRTSLKNIKADYFQPPIRKTTANSATLSRETSLPSSPKTTFSITNESLNLIPTSNSIVSSSLAEDENKLHSIQVSDSNKPLMNSNCFTSYFQPNI